MARIIKIANHEGDLARDYNKIYKTEKNRRDLLKNYCTCRCVQCTHTLARARARGDRYFCTLDILRKLGLHTKLNTSVHCAHSYTYMVRNHILKNAFVIFSLLFNLQ